MAAGRSAVPAAEARAVRATTSATGASNQTTTARTSICRQPKNVADKQDRASVVAVGQCSTNRTEQRNGRRRQSGRRPDPTRRARGAIDVAQQRSVVEPVAELRHGARGDEGAGVTDRENAAICRRCLSRNQDAERSRVNDKQHGVARIIVDVARAVWPVSQVGAGVAIVVLATLVAALLRCATVCRNLPDTVPVKPREGCIANIVVNGGS